MVTRNYETPLCLVNTTFKYMYVTLPHSTSIFPSFSICKVQARQKGIELIRRGKGRRGRQTVNVVACALVAHPPLILHGRAYKVHQVSPNWIRSAGMNLCFKNLLAWNFLVGPPLNKNLLTLKIWNRSLFSKNWKMCALWQIRSIDIDSSRGDQFSSETIYIRHTEKPTCRIRERTNTTTLYYLQCDFFLQKVRTFSRT